MFAEPPEETFHMKGMMKQFTVLCLDLIIRISVMIIFSGEGSIGLFFVVLTAPGAGGLRFGFGFPCHRVDSGTIVPL